MMHIEDDQPDLPFDERFRKAEQYAFDLTPPAQPQPVATDYVKPCGRLGYCYCPKCNPR
jgi:hypothetical protein